MTTLFSRRAGKSKGGGGGISSLGFGSSSSSSKHNRFGTGISSSDFHNATETNGSGFEGPTHTNTPPALSLSLPNINDKPRPPPKSSTVSGGGGGGGGGGGHGQTSTTHSTYADDFGRLTPTQTMPRNGARLAGPGGLTVPRRGSNGGVADGGPLTKTASRSSHANGNGPRGSMDASGSPQPAGMNATATASGRETYPYGYTHEGWDTEITQATAMQVVELCAKEIRARGLDSPLIFSSMALDLSASGVASLIKSFLASDPHNLAQSSLAQDVRYANPHNLAALIKWTLARLGRFYAVPVPSQHPAKKGEVQEEMAVVQQRGWLDIDSYLAWRERERASEYPWTAFSQFCSLIDDDAGKLLRSLFSLLSSTTSYSLKNGMTPSKLARHFGVLLFGLPEDETFARTHEAFVKASNATEHLFLAYIRDLAAFEVLPMRLMSHVDNYPLMLSSDMTRPAKHVRTVPVTQIERYVRFYSQDLIQSASDWKLLEPCDEWLACASQYEDHGKQPQLSDRFRKLTNLRGSGSLARVSSGKSNGSDHSKFSSPPSVMDNAGHLPRNRSKSEDPASYTSVVDEQWGTFLNEGFTAPESSKLAFDLHESERKARMQKRSTLGWSDFSSLGFDGRDDAAALSAVLSFDDGLKEEMGKWPGERAELLDRIREQSKKAPPFNYDGRPRVVARPGDAEAPDSRGETVLTRIDDVFAEVWADYLIGNGWSNRDEPTHRMANFVVVQYKSRPHAHTVGASESRSTRSTSSTTLSASGAIDDRNDAAWFVVQEVVPSDYRAELEASGRSKTRTGSSARRINLFRRLRGKDKDKPTPALPTGAVASKSSVGAGSSRLGATSLGVGRSSTSVSRPIAHDDSDLDSLFPPGTKKLYLGQDPVSRPAPSLDLERNSTTKSTKRGMGLFNTQMPGSPSVDDGGFGGGGGEKSSGSGFMTSLRGKTSGMSIRHRLGGSTTTDEAPALPPKPSGALQGAGSPQNGGLKPTSSFGSADFDTHSFQDPDDHLAPSKEADGGKASKGLGRARSKVRSKRRESKDDSWVDVLTKTRLNNQDAAPPRPKEAAPRPAPVRTSSLVQEAEDDGEENRGGERTPTLTASRSPATTPTQDKQAVFATTSTSANTLKAEPLVSPNRNLSPSRKPVSPAAAPATPASNSQLSPPRSSGASGGSPRRSPPGTAVPTSSTPLPPPQPQTERLPPTSPTPRPSTTSANSTSPIETLFPAPPDRLSLISTSSPSDYRNSVVSTTESEQEAERIEFRIPKRTELRSVTGSAGGDEAASKSEQARKERVSAAVLRARELRAKLQPTNISTSSASGSGSGSGGPDPPQTAPATMVIKPKIDPFAKNPTSGKVASIAARFKEPSSAPAAVEGAMRPGVGSVKARVASANAAAGGVTSTDTAPATTNDSSPQQPGAAASKTVAPTTTTTTGKTVGPSQLQLTQAALARAAKASSMVDPDQPPSPRHPESVYGGTGSIADGESLHPDDAASNYSRASSSDEPTGSAGQLGSGGGTGGGSGGEGGGGNWNKVLTRQHDQQQALQSALLAQHDRSTSGGGEEGEDVEVLDEGGEGQEGGSFPAIAREPYRPGQPLDNLLEESESQLSGTNSRI